MTARPTTLTRALAGLLFVALLWVAVEVACLGGLVALERWKGLSYTPRAMGSLGPRQRAVVAAIVAGERGYLAPDAELGWTLRPGAERPGFGYRVNGQGLRGNREIAAVAAPGVVRLAAFGDSFTHGTGVPNGRTWCDQLAATTPELEVLNFGVPGYGTDQAYLRFRRRAAEFHPDVALLGVMSDNPERNVNTFRPFFFERSGLAMGKPRYQVGGEWGGRGRVSEVGGGSSELVLVPNPLPDREAYRELLERPREVLERIGRHDSHYRARHRRAPLDFLPSMRFLHVIGDSRFQRAHRLHGSYDPRGEPFRVTLAILEAFQRDALAGGMIPIVVFLPHADDVEAAREGGWPLYGTLLAACRPAGLRCVDAGRAFTERAPEAPVRRLVPGHYSGWGNRLVAEEIAGYLEEEGLLTTEGVEAALAAMGGAARH